MRFARHALLLALLAPVGLLPAGCAKRVYLHDVTDAFRRDHAALRFDLPTQEDPRPLRFFPPSPPMEQTVMLADQFLERRGQGSLNVGYVRALLGCGYLAQWRIEEAYALLSDQPEPPVSAPELERAVIDQIAWATSACRAVEGRIAVDALVSSEADMGAQIVEFIETYGNYVGYVLPHNKHSRDYLAVLERHVVDLQGTCFPPRPWGPRKLERRTRKIVEMRQRLTEQAYNDAATLLKRLRERTREQPHETDAFFAATLSGLYITLALLSEDLVPQVELDPAQKQWLREQALSTYEAARETADAYLDRKAMRALENGLLPAPHQNPQECYRRLYARLFIAQQEVQGWITIR